MHMIAASVILNNPRGEVLLQLRDDYPHILSPGMWTVPGGYVEDGETPLEAMFRELREEMALDIPLRVWRAFRTRRGPENEIEVTQHMYLGSLDQPASAITLNEGQRVEWFSAAQIEGMTLAFEFNRVLAAYFSSQPGG